MTHRHVNPGQLLAPVGFSHAVIASPGTTVYLGGQTGHRADGSLAKGLHEQFRQMLKNLSTVLNAIDAQPADLVSMQLFVVDAASYRAQQRGLGRIWRDVLGPHYPAMALFEVTSLHDPEALVEVVPIVVVPTDRDDRA